MKDYIIKCLLEGGDKYVSGEEICEKSGVTRSAVWKYISALRDEGFDIEAVAGKGYVLKKLPDVLSQAVIEHYIKNSDLWKRIIVLNMVDSTNLYVRSLCNLRVEEGTAVFASCQTDGRGRRGRTWHSPDSDGLYMSVLFTPDMPYAEHGEVAPYSEKHGVVILSEVKPASAIVKIIAKYGSEAATYVREYVQSKVTASAY